ncbi:DUF488 domain-containing protein [Catenisphaera adipataccumulans]|jgi:uncharacterized protein YeaO (DUF488 family)|uniref:Uncharacterized protein YeaO (DUF488 family) n=1 Tax=Catenisphaera adipataccumulans TaxID=700500 RepID=A0A7W8CX13_9FIRM|nr:DUF488 family protein [Catenisphaera adipataccumulans]MBB5182519.1 uncharacterized protein YeaO (DUF488 family) [Catenisphaera adipataccumulans]
MHEIKIVRVYELKPDMEGYRILIDKIWPRGLRKEALEPFEWAKSITPTDKLRKWFGHDPDRFEEFTRKYQKELTENPFAEEFVKRVRDILDEQDVLLLYAAKNEHVNHALVLKEWLEEKLR